LSMNNGSDGPPVVPPAGGRESGEQPPDASVPWNAAVAPPYPPTAPPDLTRPVPPSATAMTIGIGVTATLVLYAVGAVASRSYNAAFFAFPFFVGFIVSILSPKHPFRNTGLSVFVGLVILVALLREGVACVLFALPLLVGEMFIGALCALPVRRYIDTRRKKIATVTTMMMIAIAWQTISGHLDDPTQHPIHRVSSETVIAAPPERVFDVLTGGASAKGPWPLVIRLGLPIPQRLVIEEPGPAGSLRMEFNHGSAHARVTDWRRGQAFAFEVDHYEIDDPPFFITRLGRAEHFGLKTERVDDWLTLREIRYTFLHDGEGRTVLRRSTVFQRHLSPDFYFGWLEQTILQLGQDRLLEQIRDQVNPNGDEETMPVAGLNPP